MQSILLHRSWGPQHACRLNARAVGNSSPSCNLGTRAREALPPGWTCDLAPAKASFEEGRFPGRRLGTRFWRGCVTLLVTHHIVVTTEPWIDEIVVMVNGRIAEKGSCTQLREQGGFYHHWLSLNTDISLDRAIMAEELSGPPGRNP